MTTRKYSGMTKCSKVTASRDLSDLVEKHILQKCPGKGRSTSYELSEAVLEEVRKVVSRWPQYAEEAGVSADWLDKIARTLRLERF